MRNRIPLFIIIFMSVVKITLCQEEILTQAEQMPFFEGCGYLDDEKVKRVCSNENLINFIAKNLKYPEQAKSANIEGTVYVQFIIDESGKLIAPEILQDIGGNCGEAALRVLRKMPLWEPAVHLGQKVKVRLNLPIQFSLRSNTNFGEGYNLVWGSLKGQVINQTVIKNNLSEPVVVRDPYGNTLLVDELTVLVKKSKRTLKATSNGEISKEIERILSKLKKQEHLSIIATVQKQGQFIEVERTFILE